MKKNEQFSGNRGNFSKIHPNKPKLAKGNIPKKIEQSIISQDKKQRTMPKLTIAITANKKIPFFTNFMTFREKKNICIRSDVKTMNSFLEKEEDKKAMIQTKGQKNSLKQSP